MQYDRVTDTELDEDEDDFEEADRQTLGCVQHGPPRARTGTDAVPVRRPAEAYADALWRRRNALARKLGAPPPPLRLPAQELQGDMPLFRDPRGRWTWLEPFRLDAARQAALLREARVRAAHWRTSRPTGAHVELDAEVLWRATGAPGVFARADERGALCGTEVRLPLGEYWPLGQLPYYGLGPPDARATVLTADGWTAASAAHAPAPAMVPPTVFTAVAPAPQVSAAPAPAGEPEPTRAPFGAYMPPTPPATDPRKRKAVRFLEGRAAQARRTDDDDDAPSAAAGPSTPSPTPARGAPLRATWSTEVVFPGSPRQELEDVW